MVKNKIKNEVIACLDTTLKSIVDKDTLNISHVSNPSVLQNNNKENERSFNQQSSSDVCIKPRSRSYIYIPKYKHWIMCCYLQSDC